MVLSEIKNRQRAFWADWAVASTLFTLYRGRRLSVVPELDSILPVKSVGQCYCEAVGIYFEYLRNDAHLSALSLIVWI